MGKVAFLWPSLMISTVAIVFGRELSSSALRVAAVALVVLAAVVLNAEEPADVRPGDEPFLVPPRLTWLGKAINVLLKPADALRLGWGFKRPLTLGSIKAQACKHSKLPPDFSIRDKNPAAPDDDSTWHIAKFETAISLLFNGAVKLTSLGRHVASSGIRNRFVARLRVRRALNEAGPACASRPVHAPVFVLGLPRTGTTFLHRLLSLDPASRCPLTYELFDPGAHGLQVPNDPAADASARVQDMAHQISTLRQLVPHIDAIHEIRADAAEECLLAMGVDVPMLPSTFNVLMGLRSEVLQWDLRPAYRNYKQVLQLLQHQRLTDQAAETTRSSSSSSSGSSAGATSGAAASAEPSSSSSPLSPPRWVLKSPMHLGYTSALREVFPDAKIVWMHRDPTESLPSLCSLFRTFQETFYQGPLNLKEIGYQCSAFWEAMLSRAHQDLSKKSTSSSSSEAAAHVRYKDLVNDPLGTVQGLYKAFGWTYSDAFDQALKADLEKQKAERAALKQSSSSNNSTGHAAHAYSMEEYGLDQEAMKERLDWYYKAYL